MYVTKLTDCAQFLAGDHTVLRELLHPARAPVAIRYSLAHAFLEPGKRSKRHRLASSEVYYFLSGRGQFTMDERIHGVEAGSVVYVPPGAMQFVENQGADLLEFLCLVDPPWREEDEEVLE